MQNRLIILFVAVIFCFICMPIGAAGADIFYVAANGNDSWSGSIATTNASHSDGPLASLGGARNAVRKLKQNNGLTSPVRIIVKNGFYQLRDTFVLLPEDSGTKGCPVTYEAAKGAHPIFSGGRIIKGWKPAANGLWTVSIPDVQADKWYFSQLFVNGRRAIRARTPNTGYYKLLGSQPASNGSTTVSDANAFMFKPGNLKQWSNINDINLVAWHAWETSRLRIASVDTTRNIVKFTGIARMSMFLNFVPEPDYYVENFFEALDAPGEWYLNGKTGVLYYKPFPGESIKTVKAVAPYLSRLVSYSGEPANGRYVEYVNMNGLAFEHSDWRLEPEGHGDPQAAVSVEAAVQGDGVRNCVISRCKVAHVGTYGIWLKRGCMDNRIEFTEVADTGAGGIRIGQEGITQISLEKTAGNILYSCYIHGGGKVYPGAIGVWIGQSPGNTISHCEIADHNYTGISIGWTWGYAANDTAGTTTEYNHIHHLGQGLLTDMGAIYNLGASPGSKISNNLIHGVLGTGIYPDEGSAQILINNNIAFRTLNGGFGLHYGKDNTVRNNIFAMSLLNQVVRGRNEAHRAFTFENNIVYYDHGNAMASGNLGKFDDFDKNLYWNTSKKPVIFPGDLTFSEWQAQGRDINSIVADPLFVDPAHDNYSLKPSSPAFKLGFKAIDMRQVGLVGDKDWVSLPKRDKLKPVVLRLHNASQLSSIVDEFESTPVGLRANHFTSYGETNAATIRVTDELAAGGKHSLKFTDAPGLDYPFNPHMFASISLNDCIAHVSFDLRMEPGALFWHEWRDNGITYHAGPSLNVDAAGKLSASKQDLLTIPLSQWVHINVICGLGKKSTGKYIVEVTLPDGQVNRFKDLPCGPNFSIFEWVGFISTATDKEVFYIDNLRIEKVGK